MDKNTHIAFNVPYITGNENGYISEAVKNKNLSGNGDYTKKCHKKFKSLLNNQHNLLTSSCTDALEMCAILTDIKPGDEVIMPTYTFVSTANAFVLRGAKIKFIDSRTDHPGMDEDKIEEVINEKTKAIVTVHYAGVACDMDKILALAKKHNLIIIEDTAQGIDSVYKGKPLGSIGDMGCFSFHETKNIQCGEGGLLAINNANFSNRAEIIWEKGTNRSAFWRGEVEKYNWVDIGSSFLPSEITAAFLYAQLEELENIQNKRKVIWNKYNEGLTSLKNIDVGLPSVPKYASNNAHMFYLVCRSKDERSHLIKHLNQNNINSVFHYLCLHNSPFYKDKHDGREMPSAEIYEKCLVRLPLWVNISEKEVNYIIKKVLVFYNQQII